MAFSFGNTNQQSAFGTGATAGTTGFGTSFGAPTSTANTSFGGFGGTTSTFGAAAPQPASTGFGLSFGTSSAPSTFGTPSNAVSAFGTPATTASTFGTSFGAIPSGGGLFGATTKPSLFGTSANTAPLFSSTSTAPTLFGSTSTTPAAGLFGAGTSGAAPSLFGTSTTTAPSLFGSSFGTTTTTTPSLFGAQQPNASGTGFGLFGSSTGTSAPLFGGLGSTQQTSTGAFGGFGGTTGTGLGVGLFGVKPLTAPGQAQSQVDSVQQQNQQVLASIYSINIFNDERDDILKKWNMLQACWGTGKGYFATNLPPIEYSIHNPFYRFKAVAYNVIPEYDNTEGIVKLTFNRKVSELSDQKQTLINGIGGILGNKPNLKVNIHHIRALSETQTEVKIFVLEKGATGTNRRILASDLANFLNQPTQKQQLTNVGVTSVFPYVTPSKSSMDEYLRTVPAGFEAHMWKAAINDNPDPGKFIPVPVYGFNDLKIRKMKQEHLTGLQKAFGEKITKDLEELKKKHASSVARINEYKHRFLQLQHRTLKILVRQESIRKAGVAIQPEEEFLKGKLEVMYTHLNVPTQYKGQLNELISTVKLMEDTAKPVKPSYKLVSESQEELKDFLQLQQNGIATLVDVIKDDMRSLNIITEEMQQILQNRSVLP